MKTRAVDSAVVGPDLTPMIGVVFQLLMFFIIAVNFEHTRAEERVRLPVDALAKPPEAPLDNELRLNLGYDRLSDGGLSRQPVLFYHGEKIPLAQIKPSLEQAAQAFRSKSAKKTKQALEDVSVVIRADAGVPTGIVQELIEQCQAQGFTRFSLQALPSQE